MTATRFGYGVVVLSLCVGLAVPAGARAQELDLSAFVDFYYGYAFNEVDPSLRSFDVQHNTFSLSLVEVALEKAPSEESRVGGRIDLDFGKTADLVAAFEPEAGGSEIYKHIQQAYLSVMAADNLTVDFGKFVTVHGAEVIESQNNWNYTRSILFGYAIPFYHVGVRATLSASEQLSLTGLVVNGWNNSSETNSDKTFGASFALAPDERLSWIGNVMVGREFGDEDGDGKEDLATLIDTTVTLAATDMISLMGNFDYGIWGRTKWWGVAGYVKLQPQDDWALAGRVEYIDDSDGGFMTIEQRAQSFTLTSDHLLQGGLIARIDLRFDRTERNFFEQSDGSRTKNQPSLTLGLVYTLD
jgi:hypothetical protein